MAVCMQQSAEYQSLKDKAGIPDTILDIVCQDYLEQYGRYPHLDELPNSNSESHINKRLKIKTNNSAVIKHILEETNSESLEEAKHKLNDEYRDKEINIIPIINEAFVEIKNRPTDGLPLVEKVYTPDSNIKGPVILQQAIDKLIDLYGIKIHEVTDADLASEEWADLMPRDRVVNAFIHNGEIYINTDKASPDSRIHEMLHLLVGSMRFTNPTLYQQFIEMAEQLPEYDELIREYKGKSRNDINEEVFIQELSKYLSGIKSAFNSFTPTQLYEINYNVHRVLDSILMGSLSAKSLDDISLYNASLRELVEYTNSGIMSNSFIGTMNVEGSALHRKLNNMKSDLIKQGKLTEECN